MPFKYRLNANNPFPLSPVLFVVLFLIALDLAGQRKVEWIYSEYVEYDQAVYGRVRRAIGSVQFRHEGTWLSCDSAYFHEETNIIEAFSNVHIKDSDTLNLFCNYLEYNPGTGLAIAREDVVLIDPQVSLTTEELQYDLRNGVARYDSGAVIVSRTNTLTSRKGYYYAREKRLEFEDDVELVHPRFVLTTDTLHYNTNTEIAYVFGPTNLLGEENDLYSERGIYDTRNDFARIWQNSWVTHEGSKMYGDSIVYDGNRSWSTAYRNVIILDTAGQYIMGGHFGEYDEPKGFSYLTDSAWVHFIDQSDSLSMHADTLYLIFDSVKNGKVFNAYYGVRFFRDDLQGACDSLVYDFADSLITMFYDPVIWFGRSQVTADTIYIMFENRKLSMMEMEGAAFIISDDRGEQYNQVKGRRVTARFEEDELREMVVHSNTETLYYVRDDDDALIGIDKAVSDRLRMEFAEGEIQLIVYMTGVTGTTWPENEIGRDERILRGFRLRKEERPDSRYDIFIRLPRRESGD
jgi:lipopolysaccharide export system protein LptA